MRAAWVLLALPGTGWAGEADVVDARATCEGGRCRISVTVAHADTGWDHYADRWELLDADGEVFATRVLAHPHVHEQPFTRHLDDVAWPPGLERATVRAHDSVHGHGGKERTVAPE